MRNHIQSPVPTGLGPEQQIAFAKKSGMDLRHIPDMLATARAFEARHAELSLVKAEQPTIYTPQSGEVKQAVMDEVVRRASVQPGAELLPGPHSGESPIVQINVEDLSQQQIQIPVSRS